MADSIKKFETEDIVKVIDKWDIDYIIQKVGRYIHNCRLGKKLPWPHKFWLQNGIYIYFFAKEIEEDTKLRARIIDIVRKYNIINDILCQELESQVVEKALNKKFSSQFSIAYLINKHDWFDKSKGTPGGQNITLNLQQFQNFAKLETGEYKIDSGQGAPVLKARKKKLIKSKDITEKKLKELKKKEKDSDIVILKDMIKEISSERDNVPK